MNFERIFLVLIVVAIFGGALLGFAEYGMEQNGRGFATIQYQIDYSQCVAAREGEQYCFDTWLLLQPDEYVFFWLAPEE